MSDFPEGPFYIKSLLSQKVLQPWSGSYEPTRMVVVDQKFGGAPSVQLWRYDNGYVQNTETGLCLDYEHGNFKRLGDIFVCQWHKKVGKDAHNQKWLHRTGGLLASNDDINRVIDIKGSATHAGAEVILRRMEVSGGSHPPSQLWELEPTFESERSKEPQAPQDSPQGYGVGYTDEAKYSDDPRAAPVDGVNKPTDGQADACCPPPPEIENPWASSG